MMKKLTAWLLLAALLLTLTACASTKAPADTQTNEDTSQEDTVTTPETGETDPAETPDVQPEDEDTSDETADPADETEDAQPEDNPDAPPEENTPSDETPETQPEVQPQPEQPTAVSVDLAAVRTDIQTQLGITDALPLETDALLNLYGIDSSWVAQSASFVTMAGTFPDEVILVEAVDETAAASIQEKLQNRLNEVLVQSESYDPDNYKAAQSCSVRVNGCYVALILSPKQADMAAIYEGYVS